MLRALLITIALTFIPMTSYAISCTGRLTEVALKKSSGELFIRGEGFKQHDNLGTVLCYITGTNPQADAICQTYLGMAQAALLSGRKTTLSVTAPTCTTLPTGASIFYLKLLP